MRASAWASSALVYTVITAILGRHVLAQLATTIANDPGDPLLTAAILHWNAHHLPWSDAWWQLPIYHPTRDTLTFSEHLLGLTPISSPIAWITGSPLAAYNLTTLLMFPLCGMATYALVHALTGSAAAAFLAGLAYAFAPYRISNLPHIQMLASFWAPLALLGLHRFVAPAIGEGSVRPPVTRRTGVGSGWWLALFAVSWAMQAASNWYTLILFSVLVGLWVLWFVIVPGRWRALAMITAAMIVAAIPLAPLVDKYLAVHAAHGFERSVGEMRAYSADVAALLCAPPNLTFWGWLQVACRAEGELFPGVALFALCTAAVWLAIRSHARADASGRSPSLQRAIAVVRGLLLALAGLYAIVLVSVLVAGPWRVGIGSLAVSVSDLDKPLLIALAAATTALLITLATHAWHQASALSFYLFAAVLTWALALGPTLTLMGEGSGRPGPFALLQWLPGVAGMRVPARFWLFTVLCLTTAAGLAIAELSSRRSRRGRTAILLMAGCALLADGWTAPVPAQPPPPPVADAGVLRGQTVLQLPIEPYTDIAATWRAVTGGWRSVNGYSGYAPNYYTALSMAAKNGDAAMFAPFQRDQDLHVVVADGAADMKAAVEREPGAVRTAQGNGFTQYRLPRRPRATPGRTGRVIPLAALQSRCASATVGLANDGDERTKWECLDGAEVHGVTADLGAEVTVGAVVYSIGPHGWNVPSELAVDVSIDGSAWQPVRSGSILEPLIEGGLADPVALRAVLPFPAHRARFVRVRPVNQPAGFGWFVSELAVRGP